MFQIVSDGGCDFSGEEAEKYNAKVVPFYLTFDGKTHKEGVDITREDYYKRLKADKKLFPKITPPGRQDYVDVYTPHLEAGKDIIILTMSSRLSGSFNSATIAANKVKKDFPGRKIIVINSLNCAIGQGLILREIIKMRDKGYLIDETAALAEKVISTTRIYFTLDTLKYLKQGGRVGAATALVGDIVGMHPVLYIEDGAVKQLDSIRGKRKVLWLMREALVNAVKDDIQNINISIGHILSLGDAAAMKAVAEKSLGAEIPNPLTEVGITIGTHAGPGAMAVAYCKKHETFLKQEDKKHEC